MSSPFTPFPGRGMPEGQGVGRREMREKPTSGATRRLLPKEGGRSGVKNLSPTFQRREKRDE